MTSRAWLFTWFGTPDEFNDKTFPEDPQAFCDAFIKNVRIKYIIFSLERAPKTDALHYQGFVMIRGKGGVRLPAVLKLLYTMKNVSVRKMARNATALDNVAYCSKGDTHIEGPWEAGEPPGPQLKTRVDLSTWVTQFIASGFSKKTALDDNPGLFLRYGDRHLDYIRRTIQEPDQGSYDKYEKPKVFVFWGPTGTGKSYRANLLFPAAYTWHDPDNKPLYAFGYRGEADHIFEDFSGWCKFRWLLTFLDRGPVHVNTCGAGADARRRTVIITADSHPLQWYPNTFAEGETGNKYRQLRRRIDRIVHITAPLDDATREAMTKESCGWLVA